MQDEFAAIKFRLTGDGTNAQSADILHPAVLDQVRGDVKSAAHILPLPGPQAGQTLHCVPPAGDLLRQTREPLLGSEVQIKISAGIKLTGDFLKAVLLGRDSRPRLGGCSAGRFGLRRLLLAARTGEKNCAASEKNRDVGEKSPGFHYK